MACTPILLAVDTNQLDVCRNTSTRQYYITGGTLSPGEVLYFAPPCTNNLDEAPDGYYSYDNGTNKIWISVQSQPNQKGLITFSGDCYTCLQGVVKRTGTSYYYTDCCGNFYEGVTTVDNFIISNIDDSPNGNYSNTIVILATPGTTTCPTPTPTKTPTPTPSITPTLTPTPTLTQTNTPSPTPSKGEKPIPFKTYQNDCAIYTSFEMGLRCNVIQNASTPTGTDGILQVIVTGGTTPYYYYWNNGGRTDTINNLSAGTYSVTVVDYYGDYTATTTCTITAPKLQCGLVGTANQIFECEIGVSILEKYPDAGLNNGSLTAVTTNTSGNVTYLWSNGATSQVINNLSPGTYSVTASDNYFKDCSATTSTTIYEVFTMKGVNLNSFTANTVSTNNGIIVNYGNGTITTYPSGVLTNQVKQTYSQPYNGNINFLSLGLSGVTNLTFPENSVVAPTSSGLTVETSELKKLSQLTYLALDDVYLSGIASELPRNLTIFAVGTGNLYNSNQLKGSTYDLPTGLIFTRIEDFNEIGGDTLGLPRPTNLGYIAITGNNTISGNTSGFPQSNICPSFITLSITGRNTITGQVSDIPSGLTYVLINGDNTISGNTLDFPRNIGLSRPDGTIIIQGFCYITGNISDLPVHTSRLTIRGFSDITGDISDLPTGLLDCNIGTISGNCSVTGSLSSLPSGCITVDLIGNNNITGFTSDIISSMEYFNLSGGTTNIKGDIGSIPTGIKVFWILDTNSTISGNTSSLTGRNSLEKLQVTGINTITGTINDLPTSLTTITINGNNTVTGYTAGYQWNTNFNILEILSPLGGFDSIKISNILIDLNNRVSALSPGDNTTQRYIRLKGTSMPKRTPASDAAFASLQTKGFTITLL